MKTFSDFIGLYPISKTIRFSLIPQGPTLEHILKDGILEQDEHRAESYKKVKKLIDEYHKAFIEDRLKDFKLAYEDNGRHDSLTEYYTAYMTGNKSEEEKKRFEAIQTALRKQIVNRLTKNDTYKRIDKKELIKEDLMQFVQTEEDRELVAEFCDFTTYFTGFHENRKNMYSVEPQSTAIAYRLIHENLPRFIDNMNVFDQVATTTVGQKIPALYAAFEAYLNVNSISEMFRLDYYSTLLTQSQIDVYNAIIGGKTLDDGTKIQGLNEYVNLYNQQQKDRHARLPKFKPLYKQILSDRTALSWLPEKFESDQEALDAIAQCYAELDRDVFHGEHSLPRLLTELPDYDLSKIYIANDLQLTDISQKIFGDWSVIQRVLEDSFMQDNPPRKRETAEKYEERKKKFFKNLEAISIADIDHLLEAAGKEPEQRVARYFMQMGAGENAAAPSANLFDRIAQCHADIKDLLNTSYPTTQNLAQDKVHVEGIKLLLDAIKELQHFVKPLLGKGDMADKDEKFYGDLAPLWEKVDSLTPLYNKVRNYMTRKPYSTEKIKLNFENSTLMNGWDKNKEHDNTTVILRKDGLYYLAIMNKRHNKVFDTENMPTSGICYEKMIYKLLPGAYKMLPKVFFSPLRKEEYAPSPQIQDIYAKGSFKKGETFCVEDCHSLIDFYKASIQKHPDWSQFNFHFSPTDSYQDISEFYQEVEQQGYKLSFCNVSADYIHRLVEEGMIYLFQIYNKDFSPYSKGTPNMHTIYWKMLFDEKNLSNVVYQLNGQAEVFFRKASLECSRPTHPAHLPIANKKPQTEKKESVFPYDLIKDRRYTADHFQLHVPITLNFKSNGTTNINQLVNEYIQQTDDLHIIGIDRGERHLLYLTLIDLQGRIVDGRQISLNRIDQTDYHQLLEQREEERQQARKSWQSIENIKELKEGYLSQAIHIIAEMMVKYHAIVVLEDLNFGFMRGRQKVEKQVYQKFEHMLIDKLNYLVDKKQQADQPGGALQAYQLASKFESFQKLGKQSGFLFYVPAWNTSKIDPVTGFVNLFDTRYESVEKTKAFFSKFDSIRYNTEKDWFEFKFNYSRFTTKAEGTRENWTLCTQGTRIETFRNPEKNSNWDNREIQLTEEFKRLFQTCQADWRTADLKEVIAQQHEKAFFYNEKTNDNAPTGLLQLFRLVLQMRNSITRSETDYLVSPVADEDGRFYDSRTTDGTLPRNADANGAYNIARKGLWVVEQIRQSSDLKKLKLAISNKEWLKFAQTQPYRQQQ